LDDRGVEPVLGERVADRAIDLAGHSILERRGTFIPTSSQDDSSHLP
jgi:hypothetical protein